LSTEERPGSAGEPAGWSSGRASYALACAVLSIEVTGPPG
jgi:hypothetical protein